MDRKLIVSIAIIVALIAVTAIIFLPRGAGAAPDSSGLPDYALASDRIKEAYLYARDNPERLDGINCWCSCMQMAHNGRIHSRGLLDCFRKENGEYDPHGASCTMCFEDALQVKSLYTEGKTKEEIKAVIDAKHADIRQAIPPMTS
ncbi:MAG: PCYCGC motif-containing (lipo)protein [Methanoregula sp.]|jgi:hypothetical protein|nr:PCYCGC motif-containing (lipo)protein [Methanoregula sp.]